MSDASNRSWIKHLYVHGCEVHQIVERTKLSRIYTMHAIAKICQEDPAAESRHYISKHKKLTYHFANSYVRLLPDQYEDGSYEVQT